MINIKNLSVSIDSTVILKNINLNISEGETFVFLGKNGSGKSILLKTIAGLIYNYSGIIEIKGNDIKKYLDSNRYRKNPGYDDYMISYVFQKGGLFDSMNVFENVAFPLRRLGRPEGEIRNIVLNSLSMVGLSGNEEKLPSELSGGMQKRVGFARAVCTSPDIILYDDPTAGLDPVLSDSICNIIIDIKNSRKSTSLVATHDLKVVQKIADKTVLIYKNEIVFAGTSDEFFNGSNPYSTQFIQGNLEGPIDLY
jgi:phospholipid/cholesterol/gamma-HCH transport system ATP-binding protein